MPSVPLEPPTSDAERPPRWTRRASALEDSIHRLRERRGRRRGLVPIVLPYSGYGGDGWIRVLCRVLLVRPGLDLRKPTRAIRGWRSFTSIAIGGAAVTVSVDDQSFTVHADRGGVVDVDVPVALAPGLRSITLQVEGGVAVEAPVHVAHPDARIGLVSDIDDTVMVTALPRPLVAAWNTFVLDEHARQPVPGMAVLYERIVRENPSCPVVYLSTGAWNVAPTLDRFLTRHLYPEGTLLLTDWGPTHDRFFRSGRDHKRASLERLAREFPSIRWILVGDDGQHDEELYRDFAHAHPENVAAVAIRQLSTGEAVLAGGRTHVADPQKTASDAPWVWAPDGAGLAAELGAVGILDPSDTPQLD
jgi:phosphatidate phosphatase APP1